MKIQLISIGKTQDAYIKEGMDIFLNRLKHYGKFEYLELPLVKGAGKLPQDKLKTEEELRFLAQIDPSDWVVLLDERGKTYSSTRFAGQMESMFHKTARSVVFIIGGAYGFSDGMYQRANEKLALSEMTFSHQMVRLIALEQIYRAMTILKGEQYHH
ncbi:MAG: 23S rRNA (pseudouridine(1915)-N(3))-methyltransferase RlmH [Flavobacteriales bacterium]|nr:23S rRNA (pseudouridine(1915)-N(3))-methyltransferase RlmH [Flavobacteriales bacterium]